VETPLAVGGALDAPWSLFIGSSSPPPPQTILGHSDFAYQSAAAQNIST